MMRSIDKPDEFLMLVDPATGRHYVSVIAYKPVYSHYIGAGPFETADQAQRVIAGYADGPAVRTDQAPCRDEPTCGASGVLT